MARAGPLLVLCEEKIREKSGLAPHRDLAELQSLSIPGTYQEKITHLGNSLMNLTGLKSLDLSRNSLVSLEGIQHLAMLEHLNLYYNCVSSLAEVFRLHTLAELRDVDFRLNPVVKKESDYRLFVVHMLPKLRQLDDRPVRASEREASWLHFASEETPDSMQSFPAVGGRPCHTRAKYTEPSARKCSIVDVDDEAVLSLIAECEWDLSSPLGSMQSSQKEQEADFHSPQGSRRLSPQSVRDQCGDATETGHEQRKGSSRRLGPEKWPQNQHRRGPPPQCGDQPEAHGPLGPHTHRPPHPDSTDVEDSTPSFQKSSSSTETVLNPLPAAEKYRKWRVPSGQSQDCACHVDGVLRGQSSSEGSSQMAFSPSEVSDPGEQKPLGTQGARVVSPQLHSAVPPGTQATLEVTLLETLLDLVDRYWSGCKSLHSNELFLAQARRVLSSLQELVATQDSSAAVNEEISYLTLENKSLQKHLAQQQQQHNMRMDELVSELNSTRKEMDGLRQHLDTCLGESSSLRSLLLSVKRDNSADTAAALHVQVTRLQTGVQQLSDSLVELQQHLERQDRTQELTHMLQESHSALVSTNEHLLQELGRARALHRAEVDQLHWSYKALKRTLGQSPNGSTRPPCTP